MDKVSVEELSNELNLMLEATLFYAGVKRENLEKACDLFVENIDWLLEDSDAQGIDEIIVVIDFLKKKHPELFAK